MNYNFPLLSADDIECRIGTAKEGSGVSLLLYKDARVDMRVLDEIVGWNNWQREHKELKGNLYCGVSIWDSDKNQWITKWDCGKESNTEAEKGEASDSFKRACFNFGIGRELYTAPFIWVSGATKNDRFFVKEIGYDNNKQINKLVICNEKTKEIVFTLGSTTNAKTPTTQNPTNYKPDTNETYGGKTQVELVKEASALLCAMDENAREKWLNWIESKTTIRVLTEMNCQMLNLLINSIKKAKSRIA